MLPTLLPGASLRFPDEVWERVAAVSRTAEEARAAEAPITAEEEDIAQTEFRLAMQEHAVRVHALAEQRIRRSQRLSQ